MYFIKYRLLEQVVISNLLKVKDVLLNAPNCQLGRAKRVGGITSNKKKEIPEQGLPPFPVREVRFLKVNR